jgi:hypothetical protein
MPPTIATNLAICHRCAHRATGCAGKCACTRTGVDIRTHAAAGTCPLGLHRRAARIPLPGDIIEFLAKRLGLAALARLWEKRTGRSCGCTRRKEKVNAITRRWLRI